MQEYTFPIDVKSLAHVIEHKAEKILINYDKSVIKKRTFLTYMSNLDLTTDLVFSENVDYQTKKGMIFEILKEFISIKNIVKCDTLNLLHYDLLCTFLNVDSGVETFITHDDKKYFIEENIEHFSKLFAFFSSLISYCKYIHDEHKNVEHDYTHYDGVICEREFVSNNSLNMMKIPCFYETFFSTNVEKFPQYFFPNQFTDYMFNGNKLISFFYDKDGTTSTNWLLANYFLITKDDTNNE